MKYWQATFAVLAVLATQLAAAEDFKTQNGKEYKNALVSRVEPDGIVIVTKSGISKIYFIELPKEVQKRFGYDTDKIEAEQDKRIEQQNAADRERQEKQENAEADLKLSLEQSQAAEQRAAQSYKSATKGTLSGQVFVSTEGGENHKLGSVQVSLFAREAMDTLLAVLKKYADMKTQELSPAVDAALAATQQAHAPGGSEEWERYQAMCAKRGYYSTGTFYFSCFPSPIQTVETDAEGRFVMSVPKKGNFVISAKGQRYIGQMEIYGTSRNKIEKYYWGSASLTRRPATGRSEFVE